MKHTRVRTRVKELRLAYPKQSQQLLADDLGVSRQTIIAIETERYTPSLDLALRIAKYFDARVEDVFILDED